MMNKSISLMKYALLIDEMMKYWNKFDEIEVVEWWNDEIKMMNRIRWMMKWWNDEVVYVIETVIEQPFWSYRPGPGKGLVELAEWVQ